MSAPAAGVAVGDNKSVSSDFSVTLDLLRTKISPGGGLFASYAAACDGVIIIAAVVMRLVESLLMEDRIE